MMRLLVAIAGLCVAASSLAAQQPTFSSRRESVRLDVLVTDDGRPVRGLTAADFEVIDTGVPQRVEFVGLEQLPIDVVIMLDTSSSISPEQLEQLRDGGRAVLASLGGDDRSALLTFADAVTLRERPTADAGRMRAALDAMQVPTRSASGGTALVDAAYAAMLLAGTDAGRTLLMAFTDGVDTSSWLTPQSVLETARRSNVVGYAVSTAALPRDSFLRDLGDETGGGVLQIASTAELRPAFLRILDEFRQRYLISYSPAGVSASGWHPVSVRVKGRRLDVRTRAGYVN